MKLVICHLYPGSMNVYGDRGNVIALTQRARWRGIDVEVRALNLGDPPRLADADLCFFGGGQDREQVAVSRDLQGDAGRALLEAVAGGAALLSICGGYQLLGKHFRAGTGELLPGISLFDAHTEAGNRRFIGDVLVECDWASAPDGAPRTLVGFENHSGRTFLGPGARPLGRAVVGFGNNGDDGTEGAVHRHAIGCYLHGSLLPKNPWLADYLLLAGLRRRYGEGATLAPLDDSLEEQAHRAVVERIRKRGRVQSAILSGERGAGRT